MKYIWWRIGILGNNPFFLRKIPPNVIQNKNILWIHLFWWIYWKNYIGIKRQTWNWKL